MTVDNVLEGQKFHELSEEIGPSYTWLESEDLLPVGIIKHYKPLDTAS